MRNFFVAIRMSGQDIDTQEVRREDVIINWFTESESSFVYFSLYLGHVCYDDRKKQHPGLVYHPKFITCFNVNKND